jgi:hypothetical protein
MLGAFKHIRQIYKIKLGSKLRKGAGRTVAKLKGVGFEAFQIIAHFAQRRRRKYGNVNTAVCFTFTHSVNSLKATIAGWVSPTGEDSLKVTGFRRLGIRGLVPSGRRGSLLEVQPVTSASSIAMESTMVRILNNRFFHKLLLLFFIIKNR